MSPVRAAEGFLEHVDTEMAATHTDAERVQATAREVLDGIQVLARERLAELAIAPAIEPPKDRSQPEATPQPPAQTPPGTSNPSLDAGRLSYALRRATQSMHHDQGPRPERPALTSAELDALARESAAKMVGYLALPLPPTLLSELPDLGNPGDYVDRFSHEHNPNDPYRAAAAVIANMSPEARHELLAGAAQVIPGYTDYVLPETGRIAVADDRPDSLLAAIRPYVRILHAPTPEALRNYNKQMAEAQRHQENARTAANAATLARELESGRPTAHGEIAQQVLNTVVDLLFDRETGTTETQPTDATAPAPDHIPAASTTEPVPPPQPETHIPVPVKESAALPSTGLNHATELPAIVTAVPFPSDTPIFDSVREGAGVDPLSRLTEVTIDPNEATPVAHTVREVFDRLRQRMRRLVVRTGPASVPPGITVEHAPDPASDAYNTSLPLTPVL